MSDASLEKADSEKADSKRAPAEEKEQEEKERAENKENPRLRKVARLTHDGSPGTLRLPPGISSPQSLAGKASVAAESKKKNLNEKKKKKKKKLKEKTIGLHINKNCPRSREECKATFLQ